MDTTRNHNLKLNVY